MEFLNLVTEARQELGRSFLVAYYLPCAVFLLIQIVVMLPIWDSTFLVNLQPGQPTAIVEGETQEKSAPDSEEQTAKKPVMSFFENLNSVFGLGNVVSFIATLLLPLLAGIILLSLNSVIILAFEGKLSWLRLGLLQHLTRRNEKKCRNMYETLVNVRQQYLQTLLAGEQDKASSLAKAIKDLHDKLEIQNPTPTLPYAVHRVAPTTFGNIYAMAEEYAYDRYGIDAVLFWPRLRQLMNEHAPKHAERLTQQKIMLDLPLNFAFLAGIIVLEALIVMLSKGYSPAAFWTIIVGATLSIAFYQAGIWAMRSLGELIKSSFDMHRHLILDSFSLKQPVNLSDEQMIRVKLAAFIRRGETFYFSELTQLLETMESRGAS